MSAVDAREFALATGRESLLPKGFLLGNAQGEQGLTGCTAILCPGSAVGAVAVRGGAPATRETDLLKAEKMVERIHAVVLSGGSAFGLSSADGVMRWLEEHKIGIPFGGTVVPIVSAACLFDLGFGGSSERPDAELGYTACAQASASACECGNFGAGAGASVGKYLGIDHAMKGGLGLASIQIGDLIVTAIVAVNALGSVIDRQNGTVIAGTLDPRTSPPTPMDPYEALTCMLAAAQTTPSGNTTIGCILTNAVVNKAEATNIANAAHDGYARAIEPVHTSNDGDTVFVLSTAEVASNADIVSIFGALAMEHAIHNACLEAISINGCLAHNGLISTRT